MDQVQVNLLEDQSSTSRRKREKKLFILFLIIIFTLIICAIISSFTALKHHVESQYQPENSIRAVCHVTQYYYPCINSISYPHTYNHKIDKSYIFGLSVRAAFHEFLNIKFLPKTLESNFNNTKFKPVLKDCQNMFNDSFDLLNKSLIMIMDYYPGPKNKILGDEEMVKDLTARISRAGKNVERCVDGLDKENGTVEGKIVKKRVEDWIYMAKIYMLNSLAILEKKDAIDEKMYDQNTSVESILASFILDNQNYVLALAWLCSQYLVLVFLFCCLLRVFLSRTRK